MKAGFISAHTSRVQPMMVESPGSRRVRQIVTLHPQSGSREGRKKGMRVEEESRGSPFIQSRTSVNGILPPTFTVVLTLHLNQMYPTFRFLWIIIKKEEPP